MKGENAHAYAIISKMRKKSPAGGQAREKAADPGSGADRPSASLKSVNNSALCWHPDTLYCKMTWIMR
jgi:hypothetical protein